MLSDFVIDPTHILQSQERANHREHKAFMISPFLGFNMVYK